MQYIPISEVQRRKNSYNYTFFNDSYPLFETYQDIYNYDNIRHSVYKWQLFSNNAEKNIDQALSLLEMVFKEGADYEQDELTQMISDRVISKLGSPVIFKKILPRHTGISESAKNTLLESTNKLIECDRVLENHSLVSKRFNIDKYVSRNIIYEDAFTETVYNLCSLIDTYNMDTKAKFATSAELALYCINESGEKIPEQKIIESVIDYFAIYHRDNDMQKFADTIYTATKKDPFIQDSIVENYLNYLMDVNDKIQEELQNFDEEVIKKYNDDNASIFEACKVLDGSLRSLCELAFLDKAKEIITKIKLAPAKSVAMIKEGVRSLLVPTRLQDIKEGTKNALSLIFYAGITIACIPTGGPVAALLGAASSIIIAKHMDKKYLKDAMQEWREHKYSVERKIKECTDPDKKRKLEQYLEEVEKNIEILEKEYDKTRDKTLPELRVEHEKRIASPDYKMKSFQVNPHGQEIATKTPDDLFNQVKKTGTSDININHNTDDDE